MNSSNPEGIFDRDSNRLKTIDALRKAVHSILLRDLPRRADSVVEVGCGAGFFYRHLLTSQLKKGYLGVDTHQASLDRFNSLAPQAKVKLGDVKNLPLNDRSVDLLLGYSAYSLFHPGEDPLKEVARVLKPCGFVAIFHDSGIAHNTMGAKSTTSQELINNTETYHKLLMEEVSRQGFKIISGNDLLQASFVSPYREMQKRFSIEEWSSLNRNDTVLFGYINDRGVSMPCTSPKTAVKSSVTRLSEKLGAPPSLFKFSLRPGQEVFQFASMRYIVAQTPAS